MLNDRQFLETVYVVFENVHNYKINLIFSVKSCFLFFCVVVSIYMENGVYIF